MKRTLKDSNGFSPVQTLFVVTIIGIVTFVGWHVWDASHSTNSDASSAIDISVVQSKGELSFTSSKEAAGWVQEHVAGSNIYSLTNNGELGCYVAVGVDKLISEDNSSQSLDGMQSREVTLGTGQMVEVVDSGQSKDYFVSEGYIIEGDYSAVVTIACKDKANYPVADKALKGIGLE